MNITCVFARDSSKSAAADSAIDDAATLLRNAVVVQFAGAERWGLDPL